MTEEQKKSILYNPMKITTTECWGTLNIKEFSDIKEKKFNITIKKLINKDKLQTLEDVREAIISYTNILLYSNDQFINKNKEIITKFREENITFSHLLYITELITTYPESQEDNTIDYDITNLFLLILVYVNDIPLVSLARKRFGGTIKQLTMNLIEKDLLLKNNSKMLSKIGTSKFKLFCQGNDLFRYSLRINKRICNSPQFIEIKK